MAGESSFHLIEESLPCLVIRAHPIYLRRHRWPTEHRTNSSAMDAERPPERSDHARSQLGEEDADHADTSTQQAQTEKTTQQRGEHHTAVERRQQGESGAINKEKGERRQQPAQEEATTVISQT